MADAPAAAPILTADWLTDDVKARRKAAAAPFKVGDIEGLYERGLIDCVPLGKRVLCRAILAQDAYDLSHVPYDARQAVVHEVLALGDGVERWWDKREVPPSRRFGAGDTIYVLSTVSDRVSKTDKACRLWLVDVRDVSLVVRRKG